MFGIKPFIYSLRESKEPMHGHQDAFWAESVSCIFSMTRFFWLNFDVFHIDEFE
ncbi:unnamed protein product [Camellia sinensis]